jgi:hypothetical protein
MRFLTEMDQFPWLGRPFCMDGRVGEHPCTQRKSLACSAAQFEITPQAEGARLAADLLHGDGTQLLHRIYLWSLVTSQEADQDA